jgi:N-acetylglucosamine-6-phosphate deacetylase
MTSTLYTPGTLFTGEEFLSGYAVEVTSGRVTALIPSDALPGSAEVHPLPGLLAPAFNDLQVYGGDGRMFSLRPSVVALQATYDYCARGGATRFMATVATNAPGVMEAAMDAVNQYWEEGRPGLLGLHLEGPYLNPVKKGAHLSRYITTPTMEGLAGLTSRAAGTLKMMTLAPECSDADCVRYLIDQGVLVSAGHSNATYEQATAAFRMGIPTATHLYNAMSPLEHRAPGLVGAIFDGTPFASVVADGIHVDFRAIRIAKKIMGERLFLITDAVTEATSDSYTYIREGDRYVREDGTLAGSCLTLALAVRNLVTHGVTTPFEALRMASLYPARVAGLDRELGRIAPGYRADWVTLDEGWNITGTLAAGEALFG